MDMGSIKVGSGGVYTELTASHISGGIGAGYQINVSPVVSLTPFIDLSYGTQSTYENDLAALKAGFNKIKFGASVGWRIPGKQ